MSRLAVAGLLLALTAALPACREDFFDPTPGQTGPSQRRVEVVARNVTLLPGEANAIRLGFGAKDPSAHIRVERPGGSGRIIACPLRDVGDPLPDLSACMPDVPDGVRTSITLTDLGGIALIREGDPLALEIRLEFEEDDRSLTLHLPVIERPAGAAACKDNACNPVFELLPLRAGRFTATARWSGGEARLEMLEGRVLARSFSSTGIPYRIAGGSSGTSPLSFTATLSAPSEYALALANTSTDDMRGIVLEAAWP